MPTSKAQAQEEAEINSASAEANETNYNGAPLSAESGTSIVNWTISGSCEWMIDAEGCLIVRPQSGKSEGLLDSWGYNPPWGNFKNSILSVHIERGVGTKTCERMFKDCSNLTSADLDGLNISEASNLGFMFSGCSSLESLDVSKWNTSRVTSMGGMFNGCSSLRFLDVSKWNTSRVTSMGGMFNGCSSLRFLDVSKWNTSRVTSMGGMFCYCSSLESLDVSKFDTSKNTSMDYMFSGCKSIESLDVSGFDTSKVTGMANVFSECKSLTYLDVSRWDTSRVTDLIGMFSGCSSIKALDVSKWDTSNVTRASFLFSNCEALASLDISKWDMSSTTDMQSMFYNCKLLPSLDISGWDTSSATDMQSMFESCSSIKKINLGNFDTTLCASMRNIFSRMSSLDEITLGSLFSFNGNGTATGCELPTPSGNGLTGLWYDADSDAAYSSSDIPNKHAATYVAQRFIDKSMFDVDQSDSVYTGSKIEKLASSKNPLTDSDYQVSYENNQNVGTATIKIAGKGKYSGELLYSFRILQADPAFEAPAGLTATYGQTLADVALPEGFSWQEDASTPVGAVGENAFHAVYTPADERNYKTVRDIEVAVRVSPAKVAAPVLENMTFNGAEQIVGVPSSNLFTAIENSPERNAGRYEVTFRLNDKASYVWSSTENSDDLAASYNITPAKSTDISIEPIPQQQWTGLEITPTTTLEIGENTLQEGIDYVFDYKDNINEGTGIAIARSKGNISDDIEIPFAIARSEEPSPAPNPAPQPQPQQYDIVYHLDGGVNATDNPATYTTGISVTLADPTKKGFEFQGWFTDEEFKNQVTEISAKSTGSINLWAKWSKLAMKPFPDVDYSSWYAPGVEFVQEKGLMTGYDNTGLFGVGKTLTRGEFATILWRHACPEEAAVYNPSTAKDKTGMAGSADGMFYTAAANWAVENDIITGYIHEDGTHDFAANDPVTFEQLITILARYSTSGTGANLTNVDLSAFLDGEKASNWAAPSLTWAAGKGLVQGYDTPSGKMLSPGEDVGRERVAVVLMRAFELGII